MTHALIILIVIILWWLRRARRKLATDMPVHGEYPGRLRHALALAQPYVLAMGMKGFFDGRTRGFGDDTPQQFRAQLLHHVQLRPDASDETVATRFADLLEQDWYRADLRDLLPQDDPVAALAFACARLAFVTRLAMIMGWIGQDAAGRVLLLNLQRAQDCFDSWDAYGTAFLTGYRQWIGAMRADAFAGHFDENIQMLWFTSGSGAWRHYPWPGPPAFLPQPV